MIELEFSSRQPIYEQIIEQIKMAVIRGNLKPGDPIPSVRKMALDLSITPTTVAKAYQELERQRVIETIRAKGTFIARNVQIKADDEKLSGIQKRISSEILELKMIGYSKEQTQELVGQIYDSFQENL